jgi:hypothetical protein
MTSNTSAAVRPPCRDTSGPTIAFCTAFAISRIITRSPTLIWPS